MNPQIDTATRPTARRRSIALSGPTRANDVAGTRMLSVADMPSYPMEFHEIVASLLAQLRPDRVLFTYTAIDECFGISRATVARRVKEGLVPGIRLSGDRVLDDGPVRRFDRVQLHWLLLAVRYAQREE